jgi:hypothetical protein
MPLGPDAATRAGGSPVLARGNESKMTGAGRGGKTVPLGPRNP